MTTHEQLEFEYGAMDKLSFLKIQSFQDSRYLYLQSIQHLTKRDQVIAGSCRHRDSGTLSECLSDVRLWDMKSGRVALKFGRVDEVLSALTVSPDEKLALTAGYSEDVVT